MLQIIPENEQEIVTETDVEKEEHAIDMKYIIGTIKKKR